MRNRQPWNFVLLALAALVFVVGGGVKKAPAEEPQVDRTRLQADIDSLNGRIRDLEEKEARFTRVKAYLKRLAYDDSIVVLRSRDFDGWVPMSQKQVEEAFLIALWFSYLQRDDASPDYPPALVQLAEASARHKDRILTKELPALEQRIDNLVRQRAALEQERERLLEAFSRPDRLGSAPPLDVDLTGTWKPAGGGPDVVTITGGRNEYTLTGTNGSYKHEGTIKGDGTKYEGDLKDQAGFCCGREGHIWVEVVDASTYRHRSVWWKTGRSSREKPELTFGWAIMKRQ